MPWLRIDDQAPFAPKPIALGNAAFGALVRLAGYAAAHRTNGYVPTEVVRLIASTADLKKLLTVKANGRSPVLHRPGDECDCLDAAAWPEDGGYWVHDFLDRNPSRSENDVHRAKSKELRDKELRQLVKRRDGNACRYCGTVVPWADKKSPRSLTIDHVDPALAAGADNLVIACNACNAGKKDCTPAAAGLTLLPPPVLGTVPEGGWKPGDEATVERRWMTGQELINTIDRINGPIGDPIDDPIRTESPTDHRSDHDHDRRDESASITLVQGESIEDSTAGATTDGVPPGTGRGGSGSGSPPGLSAGDAGPAGRRPAIGPATTPRNASSPNPYLRSRTTSPAPPAEEDTGDGEQPPGGQQ
jgi:5-methylcytosine-specific restriction endonuclease McrA